MYSNFPKKLIQSFRNADALGIWCYTYSKAQKGEKITVSNIKKHFNISDKTIKKALGYLLENKHIELKELAIEGESDHEIFIINRFINENALLITGRYY